MSDPVTASGVFIIKLFFVSIIASIAGAIETMLSNKDKDMTTLQWWKNLTLFSFVHFTSAMIVGLLLKSFIANEYLLFGLTGIGGLIGTKTVLRIFTSILEKNLTK